MGLFGTRLFGYNEKNYKKNSEDFKQRLENIALNAADRGVNTFGINKALAQLMILVDKLPYKKNGPEYEKVDQVINDILDKMEDDVRQKRMASVVVRADLLYRELDEGRRFGKNAFADDVRLAEHGKAEALGRIHTELERQERIVMEQERVLDLAAKANEVERQKYRLQYNALETQKNETARNINMWQTKYDLALKALEAKGLSGQLTDFESTKIVDRKALEKEISDMTNRLDKAITETNESGEIIDTGLGDIDTILGGAKTVNSAFDSLVEDKKRQNLMNDMGSAPMNSGASNAAQDNDPFSIAMRNK